MKQKNNNIELDSQNFHVEQTAIETAISNREKIWKISYRVLAENF